ncbi:hypothetical protein Pelo_19693 [Pelomyxa schiedti]|nr:hypothetical protein Pelo_19693 [Pelomyxa schiedti]
MDQVNAAHSSATDEAFRQCCVSVHGDGTGGVQWFLSHCANVTTISKEGVAEAFYYRLERGYSKSALFLLESFADGAGPQWATVHGGHPPDGIK